MTFNTSSKKKKQSNRKTTIISRKSLMFFFENLFCTKAKNNTKIYYSDIKKIRMFQSRRWYPTLTFVSVISPIVWYASSKVVKTNSSNCKKNIQEIKVINRFKEHRYGKVKCF